MMALASQLGHQGMICYSTMEAGYAAGKCRQRCKWLFSWLSLMRCAKDLH